MSHAMAYPSLSYEITLFITNYININILFSILATHSRALRSNETKNTTNSTEHN